MALIPIWKDSTYRYTGSSDPVDYAIVDGNSAILFQGRAYRKPYADATEINVSKIAANYLDSSLPDTWASGGTSDSQITNRGAVSTFYLNIGGTYVSSYTFSNDYSYTDDYTATGTTLTTPITLRKVNGMQWLTSTLQSDSVLTTRIEVSGETTPTSDCYAVHYLQRNGGWASYLIGGNVIMTDDYERYYTDQAFDNNTIQFERNTYHNQISTKWKFITEWLSDSESHNLAFNLVPTPKCYLENAYTGEIVPVMIEDESVTYKTYINQGRKLVQYMITFESSQYKHIKA